MLKEVSNSFIAGIPDVSKAYQASIKGVTAESPTIEADLPNKPPTNSAIFTKIDLLQKTLIKNLTWLMKLLHLKEPW